MVAKQGPFIAVRQQLEAAVERCPLLRNLDEEALPLSPPTLASLLLVEPPKTAEVTEAEGEARHPRGAKLSPEAPMAEGEGGLPRRMQTHFKILSHIEMIMEKCTRKEVCF